MDALLQDLRYGWRTLTRAPGFSLVAVLTLALGIGANAAIFSVVNAVLLTPLPYANPERLVFIWNRMPTTNFLKAPVAAPDVVDYQRQTTLFEGVAATNNVADAGVTGDGNPERIQVAGVTGNFFDVLGVTPALGRSFSAADDAPLPQNLPPAQVPPAAMILSHAFWERRFGADPAVVGKTIRVDDQPRIVVGVLPATFELLMPSTAGMSTDIDAWTPLRIDLSRLPRDNQWLRAIGRLKPGFTVAQAQSEMNALSARQRNEFEFHRNMNMQIDVLPMQADVVSIVRPTLLALAGTVGFVLLIACANVASLLLARAAARRREMAVARRSARAEAASCGRVSPRACSCRRWAARQACCWRVSASMCSSRWSGQSPRASIVWRSIRR